MNDETLRRALRMDALVVLEEIQPYDQDNKEIATAIAAKQAANLVPALHEVTKPPTPAEAARLALVTLRLVKASSAMMPSMQEMRWFLDGMIEETAQVAKTP